MLYGGRDPGEGDTLEREISWGRRHPEKGDALGREINWGGTCPEREILVSGKSVFWERALAAK